MKLTSQLSLICFLFITGLNAQEMISTGSLLEEMTSLSRLCELNGPDYQSIQFSSYDRQSTGINEAGWFANSDGFGNEKTPNFVKTLKEPGEDGIGEYLVCEVDGPGAIVRLWTARITGEISLYLDQDTKPLYKGSAADFFWKFPYDLDKEEDGNLVSFRQYDAYYFPVAFSKGCKIVWTGNKNEVHFYHIGIRTYSEGTAVKSFSYKDLKKYSKEIENLKNKFSGKAMKNLAETPGNQYSTTDLKAGASEVVFQSEGSKVAEYLAIRLKAENIEQALRQVILSVYFDQSSVPQVQSPVGDFFGAAPGINPYHSLPFTVLKDGTMICRFPMPFKEEMKVILNNMSDQECQAEVHTLVKDYDWIDGKSMHFRAKWRINHELIASNTNVNDIPYLVGIGTGRVVGATALLANPSNVPTAWGNWWGEGDEKIFVDSESFPSFFGTGSEDYFNYSWSSSRIFEFPYCGQPRCDGPDTRGFVSNYRWHIIDDIPFKNNIAFYMELYSHGTVPHFSYGRIIYHYALPGFIDDHVEISPEMIKEINLPEWKPIAYLGSANSVFTEAEELIKDQADISLEEGYLWSGGKMVLWSPMIKGEKLTFAIDNSKLTNKGIGLTLAHSPGGGQFKLYINGKAVKLDGNETVDLGIPFRTYSRNHFTGEMEMKEGPNEIVLEFTGEPGNNRIGIDFIWTR